MAKWILGHKITEQTTTGDYDLIIGETPAHTQGPPPHFHKAYHEVFIVTEGEMSFMLNGEKLLLKKGESVNLPPQSLHTFSNNSDATCAWVNIHSPKGFLKFFNDFGVSDSQNDAFEKSLDPEVINKVIQTAANYDMIISM